MKYGNNPSVIDEKEKEDEFKINFDVYNIKRLHQPRLFNKSQKLQKIHDFQRTSYVGFHASTKEMLDKNLIVTSTGKAKVQSNSSLTPRKS